MSDDAFFVAELPVSFADISLELRVVDCSILVSIFFESFEVFSGEKLIEHLFGETEEDRMLFGNVA